jgi:nickel/cobalt transporter (NiCoT) family protein
MFWASLDAGQRRTLAMMSFVIVALHVIGFVTLFAFVAPNKYSLGSSGIYTIGIGVTAYTLGMRHAFDADHISAIDNTTRKLMNEGKRPLSVGFWFSLGHSTIVFAPSMVRSRTTTRRCTARPTQSGRACQGSSSTSSRRSTS